MNRAQARLVFVLATAFVGSGCFDDELFPEHAGPSVTIYKDRERVYVVGCVFEEGWLFTTCRPAEPGDVMVVVIDGVTTEVTEPVVDVDPPLGTYRWPTFGSEGDLVAVGPLPTDGAVEVTIDGKTARIELLPDFAVSAPPSARRDESFEVAFERVDPETYGTAVATSRCDVGVGIHGIERFTEAGGGDTVTIDLSALTPDRGRCTHAIDVIQGKRADTAGMYVTLDSVTRAIVTSAP